tara:strand:- start:1024 stop:2265 length:1242 start_codon:yes stop_codon:yes gene_type:complete
MKKKYDFVIACGGLGTRLKKITNDIPKPLYPINGKSTIERCIEEISNFSICNILITLGYKSDFFVSSINNLKKKYKIDIDIFVENHPLGECGALWFLKDQLSEDFIFINGDLIFSIDFKKLIYFHKRLSSSLTLVTHTSDHPEDSDLISAPNGTLIDKIFIKSSQTKNNRNAYLGNSGISVINKNILEKIESPCDKDSKTVFHFIVKNIFDLNKNIYSYNTTEYIKDMGTPKRLKIVENDLRIDKVNLRNYRNKQKALFLDRDNTLIKCQIGEYIIDKNSIKFIDSYIEKISLISKSYDLVCLVTNQPVIAMGKLTLRELESINSIVVNYCLEKNLKIDVISFCPHHPHFGFEKEVSVLKRDCFCRKPNPGLIVEQSYLRNISLKDSLMIGDSKSDEIAASNAGCNFLNVQKL